MSDQKNDQIAVRPRTFSLMPSTLGEAMELANLIASSDMAPKDYKGKPGNVVIAIQMGADVGLKPMQALQNIAVINGRPSIYGDAAVALVQNANVLERFHETIAGEGDARTATCLIKRKGFPDEIVRTFSVADAKKAGLWGKAGPWSTYPDRMLQMRARGFAIRDGASDCLMGLILAEEAMDYPNAIDGQVVSVEAVPSPFDKLPEPVRDKIEQAFATLNFNPAMRIQKLKEYLEGDGVDLEAGATALLSWCRDEFARRKTGQPVMRGQNSTKKPQGETAPSAPASGAASTGGASATGTVASPAVDAPASPSPASEPLTAADVFGSKKPAVALKDELGF